MAQPSVDLWWTQVQAVGGGDAPIHCRAIGLGAGLPVGWRTGGRGRFLRKVLDRYAKEAPVAIPGGGVGGWRLNGGRGLHLSLSDSGGFLTAAIGRGIPVGVDIERLRPVDDPIPTLRGLGLAKLGERLRDLPPPARNRAFLMVWTAFEAFLKLERSPWDAGAARFARLAIPWRIAGTGDLCFDAAARCGVAFQYCWPATKLVVAVATPVACPVLVHTLAGRNAMECG